MDPHSVPGVYSGGVEWAVRWGEAGQEPKIHRQINEASAKQFYKLLLKRYEELGREDKPELLATKIRWQVQND